MLIELGNFALILGFLIAIVQAFVPLIGAQKGWSNWMEVANTTAVLQFLLIAFSFFTLVFAFVSSDFSVRLVVLHSHSLKPMLYKIAGTWGNHEGSMLLWVLILALYGCLSALFSKSIPLSLKSLVLSVQAFISSAFIGFLLFTSNPFIREDPPAINGNGLNPVLQDPGLALHPPFLYLGYVGLSVTFSFAVAALIQGKVDAAWARWVRPWTMSAWIFLTVGITLGSYWAYYELGWGGWWFWDPVENASFMPWLVTTALLHSALVVEKRDALKSWTILLAIIAFSFSLIGTFIVRSGILTSVHAFASDPTRGVYILAILGVAILVPLMFYSIRFARLHSTNQFSVVSRESGLVLNNLFFSVSAFIVFIGTVWPLIAEMLFKQKVSVGAPFFNLAFTPFMFLLGCILPFGIYFQWKRANLVASFDHLKGLIFLSILFGIAVWVLQTGNQLVAPVGISLSIWIILGSLADLLRRGRFQLRFPILSLRRLILLPKSETGKFFGHIGFGFLVLGVSAVSSWELEDIRVVSLKEPYFLSDYTVELREISEFKQDNYVTRQGTVYVKKHGREIAVLTPQKRFYPVQGAYTTEAAIHTNLLRDIYVVLGDKNSDNEWVLRTYIKPFVVWIWIGALTIAFGGVISLFDRRYRVGLLRHRETRKLSTI